MIYYFTRSQKSKVAAEALSEVTGLPLYALVASINDAKGFLFGWKAVTSIMSSKGCEVSNLPTEVPREIYLCGPIWVGEMAGPLKNFLTNVKLTGVKVNVLLTGMQPAEENRRRALKVLGKSGCEVGAVYMMATTKEMPEKTLFCEQLRDLMPEND